MPWPPQVGELLPQFDEPVGIKYKLRTYSLAPDHTVGGPKANGFLVVLGINLGAPGSVNCTVQFRIAGPGRYIDRTASLRTGWELIGPMERPRLTTALPAGKGGSMSTTQTVIGEHDVVVLVDAVERWPAGTRGTVVSDHPSYKIVEITGIEESEDDEMLDYLPTVATENLRLVRKCPPSDS